MRNIRCRDPAPCYVALAGKNTDVETPAISGRMPYARCTLANPTSQLATNVVAGKSGQCREMHFRRCVGSPFTWLPNGRNAYIRVGRYGEGIFFCTTPCGRQLYCNR